MRICFQSDLKDCPDLRHAGQRLLSVNPISDNPEQAEIVMEGIPQSISQFTQQLQSVNPKKESLSQAVNCSSIRGEPARNRDEFKQRNKRSGGMDSGRYGFLAGKNCL